MEVTFAFTFSRGCLIAETSLQKLRAGPAHAQEDGSELHPPPQEHRRPGSGVRHRHDSGAWAPQGRGQLPAPPPCAGRALLPPARRGPPQALRPRPGVWDPAHLPPAHRPAARGAAAGEEDALGERGGAATHPRGSSRERQSEGILVECMGANRRTLEAALSKTTQKVWFLFPYSHFLFVCLNKVALGV